nr:thiamine-phosphate synthase family protein [Candidatus Sigynarchaeota archaeon]
PRLERDVAQVTDVMAVVCTKCKSARMPGEKFCSMHVNEIPVLAFGSCAICSKYVDASSLNQGSEEQEIINALIEGYNKIRHDQKFINLIPEVQSNLVLGFKSETKNGINDYAGFPGRIIKTEGEARVVDSPAFGASKHIARILSTVRDTVPTIRSATCITFNDAIRTAMKKASLAVVSLEDERDGVALEDAIRKSGGRGVDALVFEGSVGMEPLTYVLGPSVEGVIDKLVRILSYL